MQENKNLLVKCDAEVLMLILDLELLWFVTTDLNSEVAWKYGTYVFNLLFKRIISHTKLRTSGLFYQPIIIWLARK